MVPKCPSSTSTAGLSMMSLEDICRFPATLLVELFEAEIPLQVSKKGITIGGWYKHGTVTLEPRANSLAWSVIGRYGHIGHVMTLRDLVELNCERWNTHKDNYGWHSPYEPWATLMVEYKLVTKHAEVRYEKTKR